MKVLFVVFLALALSTNALPQENKLEQSQQRNIGDYIKIAIEAVGQWLRENNLDPLRIERLLIDTSPMPGVDLWLIMEKLELSGISNVAIYRLDYNPITNRLIMDVALPRLSFSLVNSALELNIRGNRYTGEYRGEWAIIGLRCTLDIRVNVNIITGISIRSVDATVRVRDVWSDLTLIIQNTNLSPYLNRIINYRIPKLLEDYRYDIDRIIGTIIKEVGNWILVR